MFVTLHIRDFILSHLAAFALGALVGWIVAATVIIRRIAT